MRSGPLDVGFAHVGGEIELRRHTDADEGVLTAEGVGSGGDRRMPPWRYHLAVSTRAPACDPDARRPRPRRRPQLDQRHSRHSTATCCPRRARSAPSPASSSSAAASWSLRRSRYGAVAVARWWRSPARAGRSPGRFGGGERTRRTRTRYAVSCRTHGRDVEIGIDAAGSTTHARGRKSLLSCLFRG